MNNVDFNDTSHFVDQIKASILTLKRGRRFIDYSASDAFSRTLDNIIAQIAVQGKTEPKIAFELIDGFMQTHNKVLNRCDDSNGSISGSYRSAVKLWLESAQHWQADDKKCRVDWLTELTMRHNQNPFGIWDSLIGGSQGLLNEDQLKQLGQYFEIQIKQAKEANHALSAVTGLAGVALALSDVSMYERSILLHSPQLNELQKQRIIEFCLLVNDGEAALHWLRKPWASYMQQEYQRLLDKTLLLLGRNEQLIDLRREVYEALPNFANFQALLALLPADQQLLLQQGAINKAIGMHHLNQSIDTLIALQAFDHAAQHILQQADKLDSVLYDTLLSWVKIFTQTGHFLAVAQCYRVLLEGILNQKRSTIYHYALDYYQRLAELDNDIDDYQMLAGWQEYKRTLRDKHGAKTAFWSKIDGK